MTVIEVEGLVKRYGDRTALDGVSLSVERGEILAVVGPNGAGKTTLVESIEGLRRPDRGRITVLGLDPHGDGATELRHRVGAQLQQSRLPARIEVGEAVELYASFYRRPADVAALIGRLGLDDVAGTRFGKLSGGQQQRLAVALALVGDPEIAILDELTTGLDPEARRAAWDLVEQIRDEGVTVVLVTHFMEEAERLADRVAVIDAGKLVAVDTPGGLIERSGGTQRLRFRPSPPVDRAALLALGEVAEVTEAGRSVTVTGSGNLLVAVALELAEQGVIPDELTMDRTGLEDAYLALTGNTHRPTVDSEVTR